MTDPELRQQLLETHPARPGQEARAWALLQERLRTPGERRVPTQWLAFPTRLTTLSLAMGAIVLLALGDWINMLASHRLLASADSQAAGIYATAFYSKAAGAQVVWLDGLEPAGRPTYLDPTTPAEAADEPTSL